jgi:type VI secretion system protein ImpF
VPDLTPQDRLQPALLDRLTDEEPGNQQIEPRDKRVMNTRRLRQAVLRDLSWLLNAARPSRDELMSFPLAAKSVINYGLPPLAGETASALDVIALETAIRDAIVAFEPRILPSSLQVEAISSELVLDHHNVVSIQIGGQLWAQPVPIELLLRTEVDLETGKVEVRDLGASGFAQ